MQPSAGPPLVATKLFVPRLRPNRVDRTRLRDQLDQSRHAVRVSAPAGFGKSTLLADWAAASGAPVAWVSLEAADDDPRRFLEYVLASLKKVEAIRWAGTVEYAAGEMAQPIVVEILNAVGDGPSRVTLVLDDYHVIQSQNIHDIVQFIIDHLPPNLTVVIATRSDPPLRLSRMRARNMLTEVRAADLRFSHEEVAKFLNDSMGLQLAAEAVAELEQRTEGWAVGLQMAAITLRGRGSPEDYIAGFTGSNRYVLDYLTDEVLARQPDDVRQFLLETSILGRLSAPLCDAVTGRGDSERILQHLDASNLFLIPLDEVRFWYRYHHLFGTLLQHQLERSADRGRIKELHQRAHDWYLANGLADNAVMHAIAAGDTDRIRAILESQGLIRMLRGDAKAVLQWLDALPAEEIESRINLIVFKAAASILEFRADVGRECVARAEQMLRDDTPPQHRAMTYLTKALLLRNDQRIGEAIDYYKRAVVLVEPGSVWHGVASFELAMGTMATGDLAGTEKALEYSRSLHHRPEMAMTTLLAPCTTAASRFLRGHPDEALAMGKEALAWTERWDPENQSGRAIAAMPYALLADIHRQANDLASAHKFAELGMDHGKRGFRIGYFEAAKSMLAIAEAQNDWETAARLYTEVLRPLIMSVSLNWTLTLEWVYQRVLLRRGERTGSQADIDGVVAAARKANLLEPPYRVRERLLPGFFATDAFLIAARLLVHQGRLDDAAVLLGEILELSLERDSAFTVTEVLIVRALAEAAAGQQDAAVATLQEALEIGARARYVRLFVDEGAALIPIIQRASARSKDQNFTTVVLSGFDVRKVAAEGLSEREVEVLLLIAAGASNSDAARKLFIAPSTVKKHLENIYAKLGVGGRTQAIARARELQLL